MAVTPSTALLASANAAAGAVADGQKNTAWCGAIASGIGSGYKLVARRDGIVVLDLTMSGSLQAVAGGLAIPGSYVTRNTLLDADIDSGTWSMRVEKAGDPSVYLNGTLGRIGTDFVLDADLVAGGAIALAPSGIVLRSPSLDTSTKRWHPGHYLCAQDDVNRIGMLESRRNLVKDNPNFVGYKNSYWWAKLEPTKNNYDMSMILTDLDKAQADGKMLFVDLFERSFHGMDRGDPLPAYISSEYNGRWASTGNENIVAYRYWDAAVAERFYKLIDAVGAACDAHPAFAGISLQECGIQGAWQMPGYTLQKHYDFWVGAAARAKAACSNGHTFASVAWGMRETDTPNVIDFCEDLAFDSGCGLGVADCRISGSTGSLTVEAKHIWTKYPGKAALKAGVEWNTFAMGWTPKQLIDFAVDTLHLTHMHWQVRNSGGNFTTAEAITEINAQSGRINTARPANLV